jgi:hypothetical protein
VVLFLEWLAPRPDQTRDPRKAIETEMATRQEVLDDFRRSVLRLEADHGNGSATRERRQPQGQLPAGRRGSRAHAQIRPSLPVQSKLRGFNIHAGGPSFKVG